MLERSVLAAVDAAREEMIALLQELVRMPSVSGSADENAIQHHMQRVMTADGLETDLWSVPLQVLSARADFPGMEVQRSEAWGLVGRLRGRGGGATLMFNGHVDVVPAGDLNAWTVEGGPFSGEVKHGHLFGRGACDMKGGLVAALWAIRALQRSRVTLAGDVLLASVQAEEDGGMGTYALLQRGWRADACVIPEPTSLDLVPATAGALTFRLRVPGRATHASRRTEGESALEHFWPVWSALRELERQRNRRADPLMQRWAVPYALSIGTVQCGDWASSVPDLLVADGRLGVALDESIDDARAGFERAVHDACREDRWLRDHPVRVEWWGGQFMPGRLPGTSDLPKRVRRAHTLSGGDALHAPETWGAPYGSDLRLMVGLGQIPTIHYGPGDAGLAHGPDEAVSLDEVHQTARTLAILALDLASAEARTVGEFPLS